MLVPLLFIPGAEFTARLEAGKTVTVPLQQPCSGPPALAAQQFDPAAGGADTGITFGRRAGRGGDPPAGQPGAQTRVITAWSRRGLSGQQQGRDAGGFRRQLQTPALPQIQAPHLAHHHGQAGAFQPLFHGPQALLIIPSMDQDQLSRAQTKGGQTRPVQSPAGRTPQHLTAAWAMSTGKGGPPGRQHRREGQCRPAAIAAPIVAARIIAAQHFMQGAAGQAAARQDTVDRRHAQGQGRGFPPPLGQGAWHGVSGLCGLDGRNAPAQRRNRILPGGSRHGTALSVWSRHIVLNMFLFCSHFPGSQAEPEMRPHIKRQSGLARPRGIW